VHNLLLYGAIYLFEKTSASGVMAGISQTKIPAEMLQRQGFCIKILIIERKCKETVIANISRNILYNIKNNSKI